MLRKHAHPGRLGVAVLPVLHGRYVATRAEICPESVDFKSLIGESVVRVEAGSRLVENAGATMREIVSSVTSLATIIAEIFEAAREQNIRISEVNGDMSQLDKMTQRNAALVEQAAAAASSMERQSAGLENAVSVFRVGVLAD